MLRSSYGRHDLAALVLGTACTPAQRGENAEYSSSPAKAAALVTWATARGLASNAVVRRTVN